MLHARAGYPRMAALFLAVIGTGVGTLSVATLGGCKKEPPLESSPAAAPAAQAEGQPVGKPAASQGSGTIKGTIKMNGTAPAPREVNMKADPYCAKQPGSKDEEFVTGPGGTLKNVIVRVAKGLPEGAAAPAGEVVVDQSGCQYRPHVQVAQAGQTVVIKNSDQTLHNVHTYKGPATLFNQAQVFGMPPIKKKFPTVGDVVKFKCDVHPWMTGYLLVTDNPFHAVTDADGTFTIKDVPAGSYTVEVWHEKLGTKQVPVTVEKDKPVTIDLELAAK
jgi:plastocyanin